MPDGGGNAAGTCAGAPASSFDPVAAWQPPALVASLIVTSVADSGPGSLRATLQNAPSGAIVGFAPGLAGATIALQSTLELGESVTVDGSAAPGLTLDGGNTVRLIRGNGDAPRRYAFFGLRVVRGKTEGSGGAMSFNGQALDVEVGGCTFEDNQGTEGGAIRVGYRLVSNTFIHDSVFKGNRGEAGSTGFSGGAISATATNLHVARCRFEGNVGAPAGALYTIHAQPLVEDSVFVGNSSQDGAGALFVDGAGPGDNNEPTDVPGHAILLRSRFEDNRGRSANGGAALLWGYPKDDITVEDSVFARNRVDDGPNNAQGGALKVHIEGGAAKRFRAARVAFVDNASAQQGGAIWLDGDGSIEIENALFSGNRAEGDRGGGVTFNQSGTSRVTVTNATFVRNVGAQACGAFWLNSDSADVTFRNTIVAANEGANPWEVQFGYAPKDGGGNLQWPAPTGGSVRLGQAELVDPMLGPVEPLDGTWVAPLLAGSPAKDRAISPAPSTDGRGASRNGAPDIGAFEDGPSCTQ